MTPAHACWVRDEMERAARLQADLVLRVRRAWGSTTPRPTSARCRPLAGMSAQRWTGCSSRCKPSDAGELQCRGCLGGGAAGVLCASGNESVLAHAMKAAMRLKDSMGTGLSIYQGMCMSRAAYLSKPHKHLLVWVNALKCLTRTCLCYD